jgi:glyoxylase-like metal-dependent hydrolase (beta-lactamase superfamily II)
VQVGGIQSVRAKFGSAIPVHRMDIEPDSRAGDLLIYFRWTSAEQHAQHAEKSCHCEIAGEHLVFQPMRDGDVFRVEGAVVSVLHTPGALLLFSCGRARVAERLPISGHTADHASFMLHRSAGAAGSESKMTSSAGGSADSAMGAAAASSELGPVEAIFTGDCVLGTGTTSFRELGTYMRSLSAMKAHAPDLLYPGHGARTERLQLLIWDFRSALLAGPLIKGGVAKLDDYISHRMMRENQVW